MSKSDIDEFIEMLISNHVNDVVRTAKAITEPLSTTASSYFKQWYREIDSIRTAQHNYDKYEPWAFPRPEFSSYSQWLSQKVTYNYDYLRNALSEPISNTGEYEIDQDHDHYTYFQFPTLENERYGHLSSIISNAAEKIAKANDNNNTMLAKMHLDSLKSNFAEFLPSEKSTKIVSENQEDTAPPKNIFLEDIEEDFWEHLRKTKTDVKDFEYYKTNLNAPYQMLIVAFAGQSLDTVTHEEIEDVWSIICKLPKLRNLDPKRYGFDIREKFANNDDKKARQHQTLWHYIRDADQEQLNEFSVPELITTSRLSDWRVAFKEAFQFLKYKQLIKSNPIVEYGLSLKIPKNRLQPRAKMPDDIASLIVDYCSDNTHKKYSWAVLIMALSGMRNEEVTNLHYDDIITDPDTGIKCFYVRTGKTINAQRRVPIHHKLIELGFIDFVESKAGTVLFDFESSQLTNHFNFFRSEFNIPQCDQWGHKITLYSFRHAVIDKINKSLNNEHIYHLVGHSNNNTATKNYTTADMKLYEDTINSIDYHKL
ncbi:hypothetical protein [Pseudoalteromonas sp. Ps84H-4]|uniref:hypothetical protein n=1 Tax=Pseudoalteromonas sp. Ps84H-4 TaxID=2954502 RepID=UPI0020976851|nr:hypothetical protein [Pseudoalteromonas sp. Ps84H-4]MCO7251662.1 hypothetical protein [Pseudoalteromonas sp. Ps84H-4]